MDVITLQKKNPLNPTTDPLQTSNNSNQTNPLNQQLSHPGTYKDNAEDTMLESHFLRVNPGDSQLYWLLGTETLLPLDSSGNEVFGPEPPPGMGEPITVPDTIVGHDSLIGKSGNEILAGDNPVIGDFGNDTLIGGHSSFGGSSGQSVPEGQDDDILGDHRTSSLLLFSDLEPLSDSLTSSPSDLSFNTVLGTLVSGFGHFEATKKLPETAGSFRGIGHIFKQQHFQLLKNRRIQGELLSELLSEKGRDISRSSFKIFGLKGGPIPTKGPFNNPTLQEGQQLIDNFTDAIKGSERTLNVIKGVNTGLTVASFLLAADDEYEASGGDVFSAGAVGAVNALPPAAVPQVISLAVDIPFSLIDEDQPAPSTFDGVVGNGARYAIAIYDSLVTLDSTPITTLVDRIDAGETGGFAKLSSDSGRAVGESFLTPFFTLDFNDFDLEPIQTLTEDLENGKYGFYGKVAVYTTPQGFASAVLFGNNGLFGK